MIDGLKLILTDSQEIKRFINSEKVSFKQSHNYYTGEVFDGKMCCVDSSLTFEVKSPSTMYVKGSLHKFFTEGENYSDFSFSDICSALEKFTNKYRLNLSKLYFENLEFGVNVNTELPPSCIINDIVCYKNHLPSIRFFGSKGVLYEFCLSDYYFKIYDKGQQNELENNLLRLEMKSIKSRLLSSLGINTLADIQSLNNHYVLFEKFMKYYDFLIFDDQDMVVEALDIREINVYRRLKNPKEWYAVKKNKNTTTRSQEKKFRDIVSLYGQNKHFSTLKQLLHEKYEFLLKN